MINNVTVPFRPPVRQNKVGRYHKNLKTNLYFILGGEMKNENNKNTFAFLNITSSHNYINFTYKTIVVFLTDKINEESN